MWHFTGKQYRVWIFSSTESAVKQFRYFIDTVLPEFAYLPIVFALIGLWNLLLRNRTMLAFTLLLFIGCLLYAINYDIHDIDSYFLLAYFTIAVWCSIGIHFIISLFREKRLVCAGLSHGEIAVRSPIGVFERLADVGLPVHARSFLCFFSISTVCAARRSRVSSFLASVI